MESLCIYIFFHRLKVQRKLAETCVFSKSRRFKLPESIMYADAETSSTCSSKQHFFLVIGPACFDSFSSQTFNFMNSKLCLEYFFLQHSNNFPTYSSRTDENLKYLISNFRLCASFCKDHNFQRISRLPTSILPVFPLRIDNSDISPYFILIISRNRLAARLS